jgi:tripartite-type tricarboxylate transporter receptor subunit TctC
MRKLLAFVSSVVALFGLTVALTDELAWSQASRPIHVIMTVPPGGSIDFLFRLLADQIATTRGQTLIIEAHPGAGGILAADYVARATPDGTVLLSNNNGTIINPILRKVNFNPLTSFEPICYLVSSPQIVAVNSASPYRSLAELLDAARAKPGELSISSVGPNTTQHIGIERFKRLANVDMTYVPFPGGAATLNALLGAHVSAGVLNWSEVGEQVKAGKVRALATMAAQRIEPRPDLPTVSETFKDFDIDVWFGLTAPAKTPKETVTQLIDWFRTAVLDPSVQAKLSTQALYPNPKCGADFDAYLRRQSEMFTRLIRELKFKTE